MSSVIPLREKQSLLSYDPEVDGITNSLLQNWGGCRERARLTLRGWTKRGGSFALTYGDLTHWLLQHVYEDHRAGKLPLTGTSLHPTYVKRKLEHLTKIWRSENPIVSPDVQANFELTMLLNEHVMPIYFKHWRSDFTKVRWVGLESEFKIPFSVTRNGVTYRTFLRGKRDGVYEENGGINLFETKTKSRIDEGVLMDILPFESQVNFYLIALWKEYLKVPKSVRYNVVRRPGLRQKKKETLPQFAQRLVGDINERPKWYFLRQNMQVDPRELDRYLGELEDRVWDFMNWWSGIGGHWKESSQCENKYGVCQFLAACSRKDFSALGLRSKLFNELGDDL